MTARDVLTGSLVALTIVAAPGFAGMLGQAVTGVPDLPPTVSTPAQVGEAAPVWTKPRTPLREASRSRQPARTGTLTLLLLRIRECESGGNYRAENPRSTASGAWQIIDGTWDGYGGYARAVDAPRRVQDAKALALHRDRGTQPWIASARCWR